MVSIAIANIDLFLFRFLKGGVVVKKVHFIIILILVVLFSLGFSLFSNRNNVEYTTKTVMGFNDLLPSFECYCFFMEYDKAKNVTVLKTNQIPLDSVKVVYVKDKDGKLLVKLREKKDPSSTGSALISITVKGKFNEAEILVAPRDIDSFYLKEKTQPK